MYDTHLVMTSFHVQCLRDAHLDWLVVDEESVQLSESLGSSIGVMECDMCNATAGTARTVRQLDPFDLSDGCLEVFLCEG